MNTELKKGKNDFGKDFFKLTKNLVFGKVKESVIKHWDIQVVTTGKNKLSDIGTELSYHNAFLKKSNIERN